MVLRRVTSGRRVRPGSMIATRMQVFETVAEQTGDKPVMPLFKAQSMMNLMGGAGGWSQSKTTPTVEGQRVQKRGVVCNPSTGQAIPPPSSTSPLHHVQATIQDHTHKPHPRHTPSHVGSTDHTSQLSPPQGEGPPDVPPDDPPQTSPTTGASSARGVVGGLKRIFETPRHGPLTKATSLPFLTPSQLAHSHSSPVAQLPQLPAQKMAVLIKQVQLVDGTGMRSGAFPHSSSCLNINQTRQTGLTGLAGKVKKIPLMPPPVKHIRTREPQAIQLPRTDYHNNHDSPGVTHRKVPMLPPSLGPPAQYSPRPPDSDGPPPKPPRAANRTRLHNGILPQQVCMYESW